MANKCVFLRQPQGQDSLRLFLCTISDVRRRSSTAVTNTNINNQYQYSTLNSQQSIPITSPRCSAGVFVEKLLTTLFPYSMICITNHTIAALCRKGDEKYESTAGQIRLDGDGRGKGTDRNPQVGAGDLRHQTGGHAAAFGGRAARHCHPAEGSVCGALRHSLCGKGR